MELVRIREGERSIGPLVKSSRMDGEGSVVGMVVVIEVTEDRTNNGLCV